MTYVTKLRASRDFVGKPQLREVIMKTPEKNENHLLTIANVLPRRFLQKLEDALKKESKIWTPFEGVPASIPISEIGEKVTSIA